MRHAHLHLHDDLDPRDLAARRGAGPRFDGPRFGRGPRGDGPPFGRGFGPDFGGGPGFAGPGFGGPFGGGPGFGGRGRVRRGQIRSALLALLVEEPLHGYEMIRRIDERSGGRWKPSPGAVYPTLQQLADEGLVTASEQDGKRVFSLTAEGREIVDDLSAEDREPWAGEGVGHPSWELKPLMKQVAMAAAAAMSGTPDQVERAKAVLNDTRRKLYAILAEDPDAPADSPDAG